MTRGVPVAMAIPPHGRRVRAAVIAIDGHGLHARAGGLEIRPVRSLAELWIDRARRALGAV